MHKGIFAIPSGYCLGHECTCTRSKPCKASDYSWKRVTVVSLDGDKQAALARAERLAWGTLKPEEGESVETMDTFEGRDQALSWGTAA